MATSFTRKLTQQAALAFLVLIIGLTLIALVVRVSIVAKIDRIQKLADHLEPDPSKPIRALYLLHQSEYDFQKSLLGNKPEYRESYKHELGEAFSLMDSLFKENNPRPELLVIQDGQVNHWKSEKIKLSDQLYSTKHHFDSLLSVYAQFEKLSSNPTFGKIEKIYHQHKKAVVNKADTISKITVKPKKGLFGRLADAFSKKTDSSKSLLIEKQKHELELDQITRKVQVQDDRDWTKKFKKLQQNNRKLLDMQERLIVLNTEISSQLEYIINGVREANYKLSSSLKSLALKNYAETNDLLNKVGWVSLLLVLIFASLLIWAILGLGKSEKLLRLEHERSLALTQQKTDLILYMSHEIRNPLQAIIWFLELFKQTPLSSKQGEMLESIKLSSDMVLSTVNDTLDSAKLETSDFQIHKDPYNPSLAIKSVLDTIDFSAKKKNLGLDYFYEGPEDLLILGDSFRLKQILVNLLTNAVKNTYLGGIQVKAHLDSIEKKLSIQVIDSGVGIDSQQTQRLFSKFYQTASAKGQIGSGLGLYLCKQLIELQGGKITVSSEVGKGTIFSFYIPFESVQKPKASENHLENPVVSLNGLPILAVDDNEINLVLLKRMTAKWNTHFFKANSGSEALEILEKEDIRVVLTDIFMPEMDGNQLLAEIRKLKSPKNSIPVVQMGGLDEEESSFSESGFLTKLSKPFIDKELQEALLMSISK